MKASDIITRVQKYLDSDDTQIRFICCDSAAVLLDIRQQLCIGNTHLIEAHSFSRDDELPDMGALLNTLKNEVKPVVLSGFFTEWKLLGEEKLSDKISQNATINQTAPESNKPLKTCIPTCTFISNRSITEERTGKQP